MCVINIQSSSKIKKSLLHRYVIITAKLWLKKETILGVVFILQIMNDVDAHFLM